MPGRGGCLRSISSVIATEEYFMVTGDGDGAPRHTRSLGNPLCQSSANRTPGGPFLDTVTLPRTVAPTICKLKVANITNEISLFSE